MKITYKLEVKAYKGGKPLTDADFEVIPATFSFRSKADSNNQILVSPDFKKENAYEGVSSTDDCDYYLFKDEELEDANASDFLQMLDDLNILEAGLDLASPYYDDDDFEINPTKITLTLSDEKRTLTFETKEFYFG